MYKLYIQTFILGPTGTDYFRWQSCGYWNPAECTCSADIGKCPDGYTMDADGTACFILRQLTSWTFGQGLITDLLRNGQTDYLDAQNICLDNGDFLFSHVRVGVPQILAIVDTG